MDESERRDSGMDVRRRVLGSEHVDRSTAQMTPLTAEFQDLITRYAWGEIWTRPGLERKTRSMIALATLIALGRDDEFQLHIRASTSAGVTREEIREVLLQSAIYCGIPAANHAFRLAEQVFSSLDDKP